MVLPVVLSLSHDSTAAVRAAVASQMGIVVKVLWQNVDKPQEGITSDNACHSLLGVEVTNPPAAMPQQADEPTQRQLQVVLALQGLAQNDSSQMRQQYIHICYYVASVSDGLAATVFQTYFLPAMLQLASDTISNVRLLLARVLTRLKHEHYLHFQQLAPTMDILSRDTEQDVASCIDM